MARHALVLGGGGPVGIAWESGLLAGLAEAGIDLSQSAFIVGTSAGSVVGAQLALGRAPAALAEPFLSDEHAGQSTSPSQSLGSNPPDLSLLMQKMQQAISNTGPAEQARAEIGAWALQVKTIDEDAFISGFGRAIRDCPEGAWPDRFACTAVDTADGSFAVWNRESGVNLARAVASSCSVPGIYPPVTIRGRRYMDGGMRSATNADIAKGYDVVFVVAPTAIPGGVGMAEALRLRLEAELETVRSGGSRVELIGPDAASLAAFGLNLMDYTRRPAAARAGLNQGRTVAAKLQAAWSGA
jgi:NTE family protein